MGVGFKACVFLAGFFGAFSQAGFSALDGIGFAEPRFSAPQARKTQFQKASRNPNTTAFLDLRRWQRRPTQR
jgi:hypothetical protein